ncbi:serine hydrolase domain-containing protein [Actinacidiphila acidipaludis]|uniref:Beta-lactamase family protein n=1 Tax=Actinacidiphila acidipaludis TaxID=2873382 RepID=A0ABS7QGU7_9ACTN|nr:serine hydrolase domain-containing protein [Streptomyces acidipaludis]MBY8882396.1 beta-lactamase family protein [Streptomyces acidipaludis]
MTWAPRPEAAVAVLDAAQAAGQGPLAARLAAAVAAVDAPDVVFAYSRHGRRTVVCGGSAPDTPGVRAHLRYEIGSASKVFTGLLLAHQIHTRQVRAADLAADLLTAAGRDQSPAPAARRGARRPAAGAVTLTHLITHTSALPRLPHGFYRQALPRWSTQPYAGYGTDRLVRAFLTSRPPHRPGTHWHYSNFGVSVLGHALGAAAAERWEDLLTRRILHPLALHDTRLQPRPDHRPPAPHTTAPHTTAPHNGADSGVDGEGFGDAVGYRADGLTPVPGLQAAGFGPAGGVRATPGDLLAFLEAHADPAGSPLEAALAAVRHPVLRRGRRHEEHTLTWFHHPGAAGPFCFHAGATSGQQAFLGFQPATGTALAAVCTRRFRRGDALVPAAYALLADDL